MQKYKLALVGATGAAGEITRKVLEEQNLPISEYKFFDYGELLEEILSFNGREYEINELQEDSFNEGFDYAIFVCGKDVSEKYIPYAMNNRCICIDGSGFYSMTKGIPLVVPEVNLDDIDQNEGIIACPSSTSVEGAIILSALDRAYRIKRVVYSTYQAVSCEGISGIKDLQSAIEHYTVNSEHNIKIFPYEIFNNCIPQVGDFLVDRYTSEEERLINETKKLLKKSNIQITATSAFIPIFNSDCMSINIEFEKDFEINGLIEELENAEGIIVRDDIMRNIYPMPIDTNNQNNVFVGRIRRDYSVKSGINLWATCDNLKKGVALNIVKVLEGLITKKNRRIL